MRTATLCRPHLLHRPVYPSHTPHLLPPVRASAALSVESSLGPRCVRLALLSGDIPAGEAGHRADGRPRTPTNQTLSVTPDPSHLWTRAASTGVAAVLSQPGLERDTGLL